MAGRRPSGAGGRSARGAVPVLRPGGVALHPREDPAPALPTLYPFTAQRVDPPDPLPPNNSAVRRLSLCAWNETTGACDPTPRLPVSTLGARQVAAADTVDFAGVSPASYAVVFSDDRTGNPEIYFKMTDDSVSPPSLDLPPPGPGITATCQALLTAQADVPFLLNNECTAPGPSSLEFVERYFIYYEPRLSLEDTGEFPGPGARPTLDGRRAPSAAPAATSRRK